MGHLSPMASDTVSSPDQYISTPTHPYPSQSDIVENNAKDMMTSDQEEGIPKNSEANQEENTLKNKLVVWVRRPTEASPCFYF